MIEPCVKRMLEGKKKIARITPQRINVFDNKIWKDSETEVWVFGILKKQLIELGVTIIKTHNYNAEWGFLMSVADGERVKEAYPK